MLIEPNDTLAQAHDSGLSSNNPTTFVTSSFLGDNPNFAPGSDVDLIKFQLDADDIVTIDIDSNEFNSGLDPILRLFDSNGNQLAVSDDNPAPGENFSLDSFINFTASVSDTYYVGVSSFNNFNYNPLVAGNGTGFSTGSYDLEINLTNVINGTAQGDTLIGTPGQDLINGLNGNDRLLGYAGDDTLIGGQGRDFILGLDGNDLLEGGIDEDIIHGGNGDDVLVGGIATTTLTFDELPFQPVDDLNFMGVTFDFKVNGIDSTDANYNSFGPGSINFVQDPSLEGNAAGILTLDFDSPISELDFGVALSNFGGNLMPGFVVELFAPDSTSLGLTEVDTSPEVNFTEGLFSYSGAPVQRAVIDFEEGSAARFALDNLTFEEFNARDNDILHGQGGDDLLRGESGIDILRGGNGDDTLQGGTGDDQLFGNSGSDEFVLGADEGTDTIFDFQDGIDLFSLVGGLEFNDLSIESNVFGGTSISSEGEVLANVNDVNANLIGPEDFL